MTGLEQGLFGLVGVAITSGLAYLGVSRQGKAASRAAELTAASSMYKDLLDGLQARVDRVEERNAKLEGRVDTLEATNAEQGMTISRLRAWIDDLVTRWDVHRLGTRPPRPPND